ncbi:TonB-linked SusC/RagA family outer membrane protein [Arcticibacter tournemirensis]|uniref:SusC/RagA family TonB-linked outer membrane protein n=1 Tax=Arcticibacter tournemirensis TaxID=699437 RepID=A0A5M9GZL4_9SPHI|nr:SusC/RagA family TonB-linked outer membrane protein [Arcticibacter tournemirensis]KAA8480096.1 SusC/RagA family TonB-linked outer membrane protein [Arcticibacter tournemirensis]TQM50700.1 TonB-linked SusC/RagA family outer membrane protein [Arcticibacter tournemirensis]
MKFYIALFLLTISSRALLGQHKISGTVTSPGGIPLAGATVRMINSGEGVKTDKTGRFTLTFSADTCEISVSFVGYVSRQVRVLHDSKPIVVVLQMTQNELQEVAVSTGYQRIPKERATGSFTVIDQRLFNQQVSTSIPDRLEAITNSYSVYRDQNGAQRIMIRGMSTIQGVTSPLIILDNFPYEGDLNNINPNDVENITILKDAAAASIWGTKAGNGVIVITTKKGKFNQPLQVSLNASVTVTGKPDLFYLKDISPADFIDAEKMLYEKGYYNSQINAGDHPALTPVVELLIRKNSGFADADSLIEQLKKVDVRDEFSRYMYRQSLNQQYALHLSGGSDNHSWQLSSGYDRNISTLHSDYGRINAHASGTSRPAGFITLSSDLYFTRTRTGGGRPAYGSIATSSGNLYPYARFADAAGNPLSIMKDYRQGYIDTAGRGLLSDWNYYPLDDYKQTQAESTLQDIVANAGLSLKLNTSLSLDLKYQYERQVTGGRTLYGSESYFARDLVNSFTRIDEETGEVIHPIPPGSILDLSNVLMQTHQLRGQLNYIKQWKQHQLTIIAGAELRKARTEGDRYRTYGYDDQLLSFGYADYTRTYPSLVSGIQSFIPNNNGFSDLQDRFVSVYTNGAYTLNSKYTLSFSARRDASNLFGVETNNLWKPLWSTGLAWDISKEPFYHFSALPELKIRGTFGYSGNTDQGRVALTTMQYVAASPYTQSSYARFSSYANPDLKWEKISTLNLGLDFSTQDRVLCGSIEYYKKHGTDLFGTYPVDYTAIPDMSIVKNVASMIAEGADVSLRSKNLRGQFSWESDLNLNVYRDKVTKYYLPSRQGSDFLNGGAQIAGIEGKPVYSVFSYRWAGLDPQTGDPLGYFAGEISKDYTALTGSSVLADDLKYNGPAMPSLFGSLGNTFSWKKVTLGIRFTGKFGYYFRRSSINYTSLFASRKGHSDYSLRWQNPGDEKFTSIPSLVYPSVSSRDAFYSNSEVLVEKGDHVRLQYLTLGYDLAPRKTSFKKVNVYFNMNNIGIIWRSNKQGLDPDYFAGTIPPSLSISAGIKVSF